MKMMKITMFLLLSLLLFVGNKFIDAYDPNDDNLKNILLPDGEFEAFYLKGPQSKEENAARPAHLHGSYHAYRHPGLVNVPNSPAYGFRFDGKRRFNYD